MWLLPSRGRPQLIARVFSKTVTTEPGVVGIDEDEVDLYSDVALPRRWIGVLAVSLRLAGGVRDIP